MKYILVAIDGSKASYRALEHAVIIAKGLGARLGILIVKQFIVGRREVLEVFNDDEIREIKNLANRIIAESGVMESEFIDESSRDVAYTIVDVALEKGAEQIVMGASGMGSLKAFVLGSVSAEVLKKSVCPVTIVH